MGIDSQVCRFDMLVEQAQQLPPISVAVCYPETEVALAGAVEAAVVGLIKPILVGPQDRLMRLSQVSKLEIGACEIVDIPDQNEAARVSVELCRSGHANALMKGSLHTNAFMHPVLAKETGLRTRRRISHIFVMETPAYSRILLITDAAINILPNLEDKVDIVQNAINLAHILGVPQPKVAILSAVETVHSNVISTIHAAALCKMAERGQITGGILDGPLAFDTAVSPEAIEIKQLVSSVAGQADIVVVPDLESGNMLAKQLEYLGGARLAGIVTGATVPIILTSRADSAKTRMTSAAIASLMHVSETKLCS
jgi:phosphate acetyltransferase